MSTAHEHNGHTGHQVGYASPAEAMHAPREEFVYVACLHEGTVLAEGTIDDVSANERVVEVYLGR